MKKPMARARTASKRSHANRNRHGRWLAAVLLAGLPLLAGGHGYRLGNIMIGHPWAVPTDAVATTGTGYLLPGTERLSKNLELIYKQNSLRERA